MRFVVPTSRSLAPESASTSGMRKPPPISMSWPLETITSGSSPSTTAESASRVAPAQLFTTSASSAPVSSLRSGAARS